jgi:hypothetical protein
MYLSNMHTTSHVLGTATGGTASVCMPSSEKPLLG